MEDCEERIRDLEWRIEELEKKFEKLYDSLYTSKPDITGTVLDEVYESIKKTHTKDYKKYQESKKPKKPLLQFNRDYVTALTKVELQKLEWLTPEEFELLHEMSQSTQSKKRTTRAGRPLPYHKEGTKYRNQEVNDWIAESKVKQDINYD